MMQFLLSAGEASGDFYGAELIRALRHRVAEAQFFGLGGDTMRSAGCEIVVRAADVSVVGLVEVLTHLRGIRAEFKRLLHEADARKPDAAILIDFPDFNLRLARELHKRGIPVIYYVSPQIWAWRSGRVKQIKKYVRKMIVIFPFEQKFYQQHDVKVEYVGHPLADQPLPTISREAFAKQNNLDPNRKWIALLPGSRRKEVSMNLPGILQSAVHLRRTDYQFVLPVASTLPSDFIQKAIDEHRVPVTITRDARASLLHSRAAIVASGTATVEAALIGTPFVMVYRVSPLTWTLGRRLVKVNRFAMVNLIAERDVVPELVQDTFNYQEVNEKVNEILPDGPVRSKMLEGLAEVRNRLHPPSSTETASERAADIVLQVVTPSALPAAVLRR